MKKSAGTTPTTTTTVNVQKPAQPVPSQIKPQTVTINQTVPPQKPTVTIATVQPQTVPTQTTSPSTKCQNTPNKRPSITDPPQNLPQLPPRVQSQNSVTARGPPPAIPPRQNIAAPIRSSSIQVTTASTVQRPMLARQASANSIPPQCTPQPPPKFVIPPQRQSSRTSMGGRAGSISGPSGNSSPPAQRKH